MKAALPRFLISVLNMEFGTLSIFAYGSSRTCTQASLKSTRHVWLSTESYVPLVDRIPLKKGKAHWSERL